ncbi:MAG: hypothetical protein QF437_29410 [Planctomycetota bacterium]|nr:hypothetical protein [Planctomycetota bacterium]MDP7250570.1 hypothetical protein [Planctomycetota bacterium]
MSTGSLSAEHLVFSVQPRQLALGNHLVDVPPVRGLFDCSIPTD